MLGKVDEISTTAKGKPKFKISGQWVYAGRCAVQGLFRGMDIEYFTSPFTTTNGTDITMLESWAPAKPLPTAVLPTDNPVVKRMPIDPSNDLTEAEMRFVSNCVGSAISSGACKSPADIAQWYRSAKAALKPADEFETEIP